MINITSPPPHYIEINNIKYNINYDFNVWCYVAEKLEDIIIDENIINETLVNELIELVFIGIVNEDILDTLIAISEFSLGYPSFYNDNKLNISNNSTNTKAYSFIYDINEIILAIRNQSTIDLSYRNKNDFHWWDFLLEFKTLEEHHFISKIIAFRGYKGDDKDRNALKEYYKIPTKLNEVEKQLLNNLLDDFYGC